MELILDHAKRILLPHLKNPGAVVDFTMGNGHDTLFLAEHTHSPIYAFDIQPQAVASTEALLKEHGYSHVNLILDSHSNLKQYLSTSIEAGIFNLGYLPGGDKSVATSTESTLKALEDALSLLSPTGILVLVLYPGHPQGQAESEAVEAFCSSLNSGDYDVVKYCFINKKKPPYLLAIERRNKNPES